VTGELRLVIKRMGIRTSANGGAALKVIELLERTPLMLVSPVVTGVEKVRREQDNRYPLQVQEIHGAKKDILYRCNSEIEVRKFYQTTNVSLFCRIKPCQQL
jgi:hypothetical protein